MSERPSDHTPAAPSPGVLAATPTPLRRDAEARAARWEARGRKEGRARGRDDDDFLPPLHFPPSIYFLSPRRQGAAFRPPPLPPPLPHLPPLSTGGWRPRDAPTTPRLTAPVPFPALGGEGQGEAVGEPVAVEPVPRLSAALPAAAGTWRSAVDAARRGEEKTSPRSSPHSSSAAQGGGGQRGGS